MPRTNTEGTRAQCPNCHHVWFYSGDNPVTSCPRCKWRVRVAPTQRDIQQEGRELLPTRRDRGGLI